MRDVRDERKKLVFGTAGLGMSYGLARIGSASVEAPSEQSARRLIDHALELGLDTFDTAPAYGASEQRLGVALGQRGTVWTKVSSGGSPTQSLTDSVNRLGRSRVDLLQWHNWTRALSSDVEWMNAWSSLRTDTRVFELGATTYGKDDALAAAKSGLFDVVQVEFNLLNQGVVEALSSLTTHGNTQLRVAVRSVYLQGALTDEGRTLPNRPTLRARVDEARRVAKDVGLTTLALRTALEHPAITHVIVGFDRVEQMDQALSIASGAALPNHISAEARQLDLAGDADADPRTWR